MDGSVHVNMLLVYNHWALVWFEGDWWQKRFLSTLSKILIHNKQVLHILSLPSLYLSYCPVTKECGFTTWPWLWNICSCNFSATTDCILTKLDMKWGSKTTNNLSVFLTVCLFILCLMTGLVQTSSEETRPRSSSPLIVSRDSFSPGTWARFQTGGA